MTEEIKTTTPAAPAVYKAISACSRDLAYTGIAKNATCQGGGNFKYRGIDAVYQTVCPCLVRAGLVITPKEIHKEEDLSGGKMRVVRIKVVYQITAVADGSFITVESLGEGADMGDKASGKAMSYAYKSMVFQVFAVPVAPVPDSDAEALEPTAPFVPEELSRRAREAAMGGMEAYKEAWKNFTKAERKALQDSGEHLDNRHMAEQVDAQEKIDPQ